ncbi:hypothetical protein HYV91_03270 [Candidatus Wolfebacteria bacterium]|nr:hypothetical protein [Candidatus Wolfebacteria bacterium]
MSISKQKIDELKKIIKDDFGEELTDQEAHDAAFNLVGFYDTLMQCAVEDIQAYIRTGEIPPGTSPEHAKWLASEAERIKKLIDSKNKPA